MSIINRTRHLFVNPYIAFFNSITNRQFDDALYYIKKMSHRDINRPVSKAVSKFTQTYDSLQGFTPLMLVTSIVPSATPEGLKLLQALLERGADTYYVNQKIDTSKRDSFFNLLNDVSSETIQLLKPYLDVRKKVTQDGDNILVTAMSNRYLKRLFAVLTPEQIKEGLLHQNDKGRSALVDAAFQMVTQYWRKDLKIVVSKSKELSIDLNTMDGNGYTMASVALKSVLGSDLLQCLVQNGADLNAPIYNGETLLMKGIRDNIGVKYSSFETALALSDVNTRTEQGGPTALCLASSRSYYEMINALLDAGAKVLPQDEEIVISGILKNKKLKTSQTVDLLRQIQKQIPNDNFKKLLEKGLRNAYHDDENNPLSQDVSLIRFMLEKDNYVMASFLMDNGISPLDKAGRSSDGIMFQDAEFKDLLMLYEEVFERKENGKLPVVSYDDMIQGSIFLNSQHKPQLDFLRVLGSLSKCLDEKGRIALVSGDKPMTRANLYVAKRMQRSINNALHERE